MYHVKLSRVICILKNKMWLQTFSFMTIHSKNIHDM